MPQVAGSRLGKEIGGVHAGQYAKGNTEQHQARLPDRSTCKKTGQKVEDQNTAKTQDDKSAPDQPTLPLRTGKDQHKALGVVQIGDENQTGESEKYPAQNRGQPLPEHMLRAQQAKEHQKSRNQVRARGNPLGPGIQAQSPVPRGTMRHVIGQHGLGRAIMPGRMARGHLLRFPALLAPHKKPAFGSGGRQRVERGLVCASVEQFGVGFLFGPTDGNGLPAHDCCHA